MSYRLTRYLQKKTFDTALLTIFFKSANLGRSGMLTKRKRKGSLPCMLFVLLTKRARTRARVYGSSVKSRDIFSEVNFKKRFGRCSGISKYVAIYFSAFCPKRSNCREMKSRSFIHFRILFILFIDTQFFPMFIFQRTTSPRKESIIDQHEEKKLTTNNC